ncbi:MAG: CHAD domain-containing protein [Solirubrobacteraceae bacterium]
MAYRFEADETVGEAFARAAREQLAAAETALTRKADSDPTGAVHTARKSIKKERALLRLMRGSVDGDRRRAENTALRDAARTLSGARDADVMIETLDELSHRYVGQLPHHEFETIRERLQAGKSSVESANGSGVSAAAAASELAAARARIGQWTLKREGWRGLEPGLHQSYRRGTKAFATAQRDPSDTNLHEWRKRVKDLWYQLRLLAPVCGPVVRGQAQDAHTLADLLGDDHDLAVLRQTLVSVSGGVAADIDAVLGLVDHRRSRLQAEAFAFGGRVYAERPKAFVRRMRACWRTGRRLRRESQQRDPIDLAEMTRTAAAR